MNNLNNLENSNKTKNFCYTLLAVLIISLIWIAVLAIGVLLALIFKEHHIILRLLITFPLDMLMCIPSLFATVVVSEYFSQKKLK